MQIHVTREGDSLGPYSADEVNAHLRAGRLAPTDLGWVAGMGERWVPLSSLPSLDLPPPPPTPLKLPVPPGLPPSPSFASVTAINPPDTPGPDHPPEREFAKPSAGKLLRLLLGILTVALAVLAVAGWLLLHQSRSLREGSRTELVTPTAVPVIQPPADDQTSRATIAPFPQHYVNDWANLLKVATVETLDHQLAEHERQTSDQVVVAVMGKLPADVTVEAYTLQLFNTWGVGQKGRNNGVILFVFPQDRKVRIQVGRGLTNTLTDARCLQIIKEEIVPSMRAGDYDAGTTAGVQAILATLRPVTVR